MTSTPARTGIATAPLRFGFATIPRAARGALQWRLLLLWTAALLLPTLVVALPAWQMLGDSLDHSLHAAALAQALDLSTIADLVEAGKRYSSAFGSAQLVALALTLLLSPLLSGMTIAAARAPQRLGFGGLIAGGVAEYARLLRMLVWSLVPLGIAGALGGMAIGAANKYGDKAILAADADHAMLAALVVAGLLLLVAHASVDAGRAVLAIDRRRKSAVLAWWAGAKLVNRRAVASLGVYLVIMVVGLALAALLGLARFHVAPLGAASFIGALALTQLTVMVVAWMRSARLFAMIERARSASA